jgi:hypothetical protein
VSWWGAFGIVVGLLVLGVLVAAALLDRRARAQGVRYHPEMARKLRTERGELRRKRDGHELRTGRPRRGEPREHRHVVD